MKAFIAIIGFGFAFAIGLSVNSILYAQTTTNSTTYAPVVQSSDSLIASITAIVVAVAGLITMLVQKGVLDKRIGTVAVMASDSAVAVKDNRQTIKDLAQNTYEVVKIASPETAAAADQKLVPAMDRATAKLNEYTPKVDKFTALGNRLSKAGKTSEDEIKAMAGDIPDSIVPS